MTALEDGTYDAIIVDAEEREDGRVSCEVTLLDGAHKGDMVTIVADLTMDPLDLLAIPATLTVRDGEPHLVIEP